MALPRRRGALVDDEGVSLLFELDVDTELCLILRTVEGDVVVVGEEEGEVSIGRLALDVPAPVPLEEDRF